MFKAGIELLAILSSSYSGSSFTTYQISFIQDVVVPTLFQVKYQTSFIQDFVVLT